MRGITAVDEDGRMVFPSLILIMQQKKQVG